MFLLEGNTNSYLPILIALCVITVPVIVLAIIIFIKQIVKASKKMNKKVINFDYEAYFGGKDNIENIEVVMSRVNVTVKDLEKVQLEELKNQGIGLLISGNVVKCSNQDFADKVSKQLK